MGPSSLCRNCTLQLDTPGQGMGKIENKANNISSYPVYVHLILILVLFFSFSSIHLSHIHLSLVNLSRGHWSLVYFSLVQLSFVHLSLGLLSLDVYAVRTCLLMSSRSLLSERQEQICLHRLSMIVRLCFL